MRRNYWAVIALVAPLVLSTLAGKVGRAARTLRQEFSNTCEFREGPRRGQRQRYPGQPPLPVGSPCHDGRRSRGVIVAEGARTAPPSVGSAATSRACYFILGPKAGKTEVFSGRPAAPMGGACHDGASSRGIVVVEGMPSIGQFGLRDDEPTCKDIARVAVPYRYNDMIPKSGLATFDQSGPVIFLRGSQLPTFSASVRTFLVAHECGHHALGQVRAILLYQLPVGPEGELAADCFAMNEMKRLELLDDQRVNDILNFLARVPGDPTTYDGPIRVRRLRQCMAP